MRFTNDGGGCLSHDRSLSILSGTTLQVATRTVLPIRDASPGPTADGHMIVGTQNTLIDIEMDPKQWNKMACQMAGRRLSTLEWERYLRRCLRSLLIPHQAAVRLDTSRGQPRDAGPTPGAPRTRAPPRRSPRPPPTNGPPPDPEVPSTNSRSPRPRADCSSQWAASLDLPGRGGPLRMRHAIALWPRADGHRRL